MRNASPSDLRRGAIDFRGRSSVVIGLPGAFCKAGLPRIVVLLHDEKVMDNLHGCRKGNASSETHELRHGENSEERVLQARYQRLPK